MYTYSRLKEALYGKGGVITKDWTPNAIRALVISGQFIFIAYHLKQPKFVMLDAQEVVRDLQNNGSSGSLVNLLNQKQLSCLEEIYVDSLFMNYKGVMDIDTYATSLINTKSRLRFYGYCHGVNLDELCQKYSYAQMNQLSDYTYAFDSSRSCAIQYTQVDNPNWYTKYNLRPDKYGNDAPNGQLAKYFARIQKGIEDKYAAELAAMTAKSEIEAVSLLYSQDCKNVRNISMYLTMYSVVKSSGRSNQILKDVFECITQVYVGVNSHKLRMGRDTFLNYMKAGSVKSNDLVNSVYQKLALFDNNKEESYRDLETLINRTKCEDGLLGFHSAYSKAMVQFVGDCNKSKNDTYLMLICILTEMNYDIKGGDISSVIKEIGTKPSWFSEYNSILMGMCGYTEETLLRESKAKKGV